MQQARGNEACEGLLSPSVPVPTNIKGLQPELQPAPAPIPRCADQAQRSGGSLASLSKLQVEGWRSDETTRKKLTGSRGSTGYSPGQRRASSHGSSPPAPRSPPRNPGARPHEGGQWRPQRAAPHLTLGWRGGVGWRVQPGCPLAPVSGTLHLLLPRCLEKIPWGHLATTIS